MNSKEYTLKDLLDEYTLRIPKIQRGYAQGRLFITNNKEILGETFLQYLSTKLENDEDIKLDFVYAYESGKPKQILPYDGQQRLTTLWLLYIFFAIVYKKDGNISLENFSYENRDSSSEFCKKIAEEAKTILNEKTKGNEETEETEETENKKENNLKVSTYISNCSWFYKKWKLDPTIIGMLNMLDKVQEYFNFVDQKDKVERIFENICKIKFVLIVTEKTDDELYIKMNSRGKTLNNFENFKADLLDFIYEKYPDGGHKKYLDLSKNIEYEWAEIFWKSAKGKNDKSSRIADNLFFEQFNRIVSMYYLLNSKSNDEYFENMFKSNERVENNNNDERFRYTSFKNYSSVCDDKLLEWIDKIFDSIEKYKTGSLKKFRIPIWDKDNKSFVQLTFEDRVKMFGLYLFFVYNDISNNKLLDKWVCIVENVAANTPLDDVDVFKLCAKRLFELSKNLENATNKENFYEKVYDKYKNNDLDLRLQIDEEILKMSVIHINKIIEKNKEDFETLFNDAEKNQCFNGRVRVAFENPDKKNNTFEKWGKAQNFEKLEKRFKICSEIFIDGGFNNKKYGWRLYKYLLKIAANDYRKLLQNYSTERMRLYFLDCIEKHSIDAILDITNVKNVATEFDKIIKKSKNPEIDGLCGNDKILEKFHNGWKGRKNTYTLDVKNKRFFMGRKNTKDQSKIIKWK